MAGDAKVRSLWVAKGLMVSLACIRRERFTVTW